MKLKLILFITAIVVVVVSVGVQAATKCAPHKGTCSYYQCLSYGMSCADTDYTTNLALRFCVRFDETLETYTPQGRAFIKRVEVCLQDEIEKSFTPQTTCSDLGANAPAQHTSCYVRSGFCSLPFRDQTRIAQLVLPALADPANGFTDTLIQVGAMCAGRYF